MGTKNLCQHLWMIDIAGCEIYDRKPDERAVNLVLGWRTWC